MTELEINNLVKRFAEVEAVKGVNLKVKAGSLVALSRCAQWSAEPV